MKIERINKKKVVVIDIKTFRKLQKAMYRLCELQYRKGVQQGASFYADKIGRAHV